MRELHIITVLCSLLMKNFPKEEEFKHFNVENYE
jgi:hypothetical protein